MTASLLEASQAAKAQMSQLLGSSTEAVSRMLPAKGGLRMHVEVVELERVPPSTSILATYEVTIDENGNVLSFQRFRLVREIAATDPAARRLIGAANGHYLEWLRLGEAVARAVRERVAAHADRRPHCTKPTISESEFDRAEDEPLSRIDYRTGSRLEWTFGGDRPRE